LKFKILVYQLLQILSLPAWGEWIEIKHFKKLLEDNGSLPAWGEWIEIRCIMVTLMVVFRLSPHGESGLKYYQQ